MVEVASKWHVPSSRTENKSEKLYRINEEIHSARESIKESTKLGDWHGIQIQLRRIELLTESKDTL